MKLTSVAINRPVATVVLMITAIALGLYGYFQLPLNYLPDITYPMIKLYVHWPGATPEEINDNIADPIERVLSTVDNLDYLESSSIEGTYTLLLNFKYGTDVDVAYQDAVAKLGLASRDLPPDADPPMMFKADPTQTPVTQLVVESEKRDMVQLRTWVENVLQDQFLTIPGVAGTEVVGGLEREIRVHLDSERLAAYGISIGKVIQRLKEENIEQLGGRITEGDRESILRTTAEFKDLEDIRNVILVNDGLSAVKLKDVATVQDSHEEQRIITRYNGKPAIKLNVLKQADANTVQVASAVNDLINRLEATTLPSDIHLATVENQVDYVKGAISGVSEAVIAAIVLIILVVYLFLGRISQVIIMLIALSLTIVFNFFLMKLAGFSLNIFSLGGLIVAMAVVIDNSVVVVENITRVARTNEKNQDVAESATAEVSTAVLASTITFIALFLPFLLIHGLTTLYFRELVIIIIGILVTSLLVALTVTPMLTRWLVLSRGKRKRANPIEKAIEKLNHVYQKALSGTLKMRWLLLGSFILLLIGSLVFCFGRLGSEFLPKVDDGRVMIKAILPTGTSVERTDRLLSELEELVRDDAYVKGYYTLSGGKVWGPKTYQVSNEGEIDVELVDRNKRPFSTEEYIDKIRPKVMTHKVSGTKLIVKHAKMKGIRKTGESDVDIKVRGFDLEKLNEIAHQVAARIGEIRGLTNIRVNAQITKPEYQLEFDRLRLAELKIPTQSVSSAVKTLVNGTIASRYREAGEYYDIRVVVPENQMQSYHDAEEVYVDTPDGSKVPLRTVAQIIPAMGPVEIVREDQIKQVLVSSDAIEGTSVGDMTAEISKVVSDFHLPEGYSFELGGQAYLMKESQKTLAPVILFALFLAYVILAILFNSFWQPILILLGVPFAFTGVFPALLITGFPIGSTVFIGVLIMTGAIAIQGIVLISFINEYRQKGLSLREAIIEAAPLRLRPILMVESIAILGLLPLAINWSGGGDMLQPMAIAVMGGLFFSLFVTLFLLPTLYYTFAGWSTKEL